MSGIMAILYPSILTDIGISWEDVIKTSGNRIGSVEIEAAITAHLAVAEAMAIGVPDELKGQSIVARVVLKREYENCKR